ncbi:MAG: DNA-directed RNA polymerase subunit beta [SAR202 cluster bacterium]|nr:DNA-directed RNA polymerase subunit beta [SAR202 cluster bacterium]
MSLAFSEQPNSSTAKNRQSFSRLPDILDVPNLVQVQLDSYNNFRDNGLLELLGEVSPIQDVAREALPSDLLANNSIQEIIKIVQDTPTTLDPTGGRYSLTFTGKRFNDPKYNEIECRDRDLTYSSPLYVTAQLVTKETGEVKEQELFMGDIPLMTDRGTFIINGAERVVVSQLVRSPGAYFTIERDSTTGRPLCFAKLIPSRGAWLEFETSAKGVISVKVDRRRKMPVTTLLRSLGYGTDEAILSLFSDLENDTETNYIQSTIDREPGGPDTDEALLDFFKRLRPGEPAIPENAKSLLFNLFFNRRRYDLGKVGRYKLNRALSTDYPEENRVLTPDDLVRIIRKLIMVNQGKITPDDIDHLGNRRVRAVGELVQNQFRIGLLRMERVARERMTLVQPENATPGHLINVRPIVASVREFFGGSQLSQFMDQTNPLAELTHKRRLSALGPGGLSRERAGFDVRDVHYSHYGRICPIETPEGPNIGLLGSLASYARVNSYGFIETPYRRVIKEMEVNDPDLIGRASLNDISTKKGELIVSAGSEITEKDVTRLKKSRIKNIEIKPAVADEIEYLPADVEDDYHVAQANSILDDRNQFVDDRVEARNRGQFRHEPPTAVQFMDVSPQQIFSVSTSLIPFLEHDDANRALMGSNMQRQAVPLLRPEAPVVGTGMEKRVAQDSGQIALASVSGEIVSVTANSIRIRDEKGKDHPHPVRKFERSNQGTCINQRPIVGKGNTVEIGQPIVDSSSTQNGELALGQNVLCAFMSWEGYNFEDAIIISETMVRDDKFTSVHIEKYEIEARDTKLGPEEITRDIPNVGEESLNDLDEEGVIRVGAKVGPGDILVGKITPKGETELSPEEKLLRAIFGEKARDVKDSSLRVPHGESGKVIEIKTLSRADKDELSAGINKMVRVWVAQTRKISEGDKMAGRHGNKGVVARIMPSEDMPCLPDGTPIDIILNPIGVPSRMNLGQILETHIGSAARQLGFNVKTPVFNGATTTDIEDSLSQAWLVQRAGAAEILTGNENITFNLEQAREWVTEQGFDGDSVFSKNSNEEAKRACLTIWLKDQGAKIRKLDVEALEERAAKVFKETGVVPPLFGKMQLRDGRSGETFDQEVTVGSVYMLKLIHQVEDKIHARSTGPYSLITQQPLGGKAQFGGQRFGEMEVWALEAYSAAYNLQEMLTVKSDDVQGRQRTYESIVKGENVFQPGIPESFNVLQKELQSLGLAVDLLQTDQLSPADAYGATPEPPPLEEQRIQDEMAHAEEALPVPETEGEPEGVDATPESIKQNEEPNDS